MAERPLGVEKVPSICTPDSSVDSRGDDMMLDERRGNSCLGGTSPEESKEYFLAGIFSGLEIGALVVGEGAGTLSYVVDLELDSLSSGSVLSIGVGDCSLRAPMPK